MTARLRMRFAPGLLVAAVVAAAAASVYVAWRAGGPDAPLADLIEASASSRLIEPRLTGGFRHAALSRTRGEAARERSAALQLAAARARELAAASPSPAHAALAGKALLLDGRTDAAIAAFSEAAASRPDAAVYSDLAAAYLVRAETSQNQADGIRALNASLRALRLDPRLAEARFNAALALERNHLDGQAADAWKQYLAIDPRSGWAAEARERNARDATSPSWLTVKAKILADGAQASDAERTAVERYPQNVRLMIQDELLPQWAAGAPGSPESCRAFARAATLASRLLDRGGDRMAFELTRSRTPCPVPSPGLREGLIHFGEARRLVARSEFGSAEPVLLRATSALRRAGSPLAFSSLADFGFVRFQSLDYPAAHAAAGEATAAARRGNYAGLLASALFVEALVMRNQGRIDQALRLCEEAIEAYERVGELGHARSTANSAADIARSTGNRSESWRWLTRAIGTVRDEPLALRRYLTYYNAALFARHDGMLDAALAFQSEAIKAAHVYEERGVIAQAYGHRAFLEFAIGAREQSLRSLAQARDSLRGFEERTRAYLQAELDIIEASIRLEREPRQAQTLLKGAAETIVGRSPQLTSDVYVALGRSAIAAGDTEEAARAWLEGIQLFESRRRRIEEEDARIAYFGTARDLYTGLIHLRLDTGDQMGALELSDRVRARALIDLARDSRPVAGMSVAALREVIGPDAAFVEYFHSGGEFAAWVVTSSEVHLHRGTLDAETLRTVTAGDATALTSASSTLHDVLVKPLQDRLKSSKTIFVSADGQLHRIPFAALVDRSTGRMVVENHATVMVPSAAWLIQEGSAAEPLEAKNAESILVVGNPSFERSLHPALPALPASEKEALAIAAMYERPQLLVGPAATRTELLRRLAAASIVHYAGHAVLNPAAPDLSYLLLAPSSPGDDGRLRVPEIAGLQLKGTDLVILGACSTGTGDVRFGEGPLTIARPFLAAGASSIVASLWDVDDAATQRLLVLFHRELQRGLAPAQALRAAQLGMLRSAQASDRDPRHWASFIAIGSTVTASQRRIE